MGVGYVERQGRSGSSNRKAEDPEENKGTIHPQQQRTKEKSQRNKDPAYSRLSCRQPTSSRGKMLRSKISQALKSKTKGPLKIRKA